MKLRCLAWLSLIVLASCGSASNSMPCDGVTCGAHAACNTTSGDCECATGFTGDGTTCADVDECVAEPFTCDPNAACVNAPGGYGCTCNPGFLGDGVTCTRAIGHVVAIGHDFFDHNADMDRLLGNAVFLAQTTGPVNVLGFQQ